MKRKTAGTVADIAALAIGIGFASGVAKSAAKRVLQEWNVRKRLAMRVGAPPSAHLAASQVGYPPPEPTQFSAPRQFQSSRVVRAADGSVAFVGGAPARAVSSGITGAVQTVWIGDFSALTAPGRYRIGADDGATSFPFDVRSDVFDGPVRAVQRWFYFQRAFTAVEAVHAEGPWVHPSDADKAPPDVRAGWPHPGASPVSCAL